MVQLSRETDTAVKGIASMSPEDTVLGPYFTRLLFGEYVRPVPFKKSTWSPNLEIRLPLPGKLQDSTVVSYSTAELKGVGDFMNDMSGKTTANLLRGQSALLTSATDALTSLAGTGPLSRLIGAASQVTEAQGFTAENIAIATQQERGQLPNPNLSAQFTGPVLRQYSYTWALYPRSEEESKGIQSLIFELKKRTLPAIDIDATAIMKYPNLVQVNFFPWDSGAGAGGHVNNNYFNKDTSIIRHKRSFVTSMNIDYNPYGTPAFFESTRMPVSYQLTLNFQEAEYATAEDWDGSSFQFSGQYPPSPGEETVKAVVLERQVAEDLEFANKGEANKTPIRGNKL